MKTSAFLTGLFSLVLLSMISTLPAQAADSCRVSADGRHLAGAARSSFLKKCETDARARCQATADDQHLHGAARNSSVNKCVHDSVG